jgi:hypothetical protein
MIQVLPRGRRSHSRTYISYRKIRSDRKGLQDWSVTIVLKSTYTYALVSHLPPVIYRVGYLLSLTETPSTAVEPHAPA